MLKMRYFGHVMRAHQSLEKYIMLGITAGERKKGKPSMWWTDDIKSVTGLSVNDLKRIINVVVLSILILHYNMYYFAL